MAMENIDASAIHIAKLLPMQFYPDGLGIKRVCRFRYKADIRFQSYVINVHLRLVPEPATSTMNSNGPSALVKRVDQLKAVIRKAGP